jgi:hypothetical protein
MELRSSEAHGPARSRRSRVASIVLTTFCALYVGWFIYGNIILPRIYSRRFIKSHAVMEVCASSLKSYHGAFGYYPASLEDACKISSIDGWGNPLRYRSDGSHFVLASLGKDGKPDLFDLPYLEEWNKPFDLLDHCDFPKADEVLTDKTWIARCST